MMYWYFIRGTLAPEARCLNNKKCANNRIGGYPMYIGGDLLHAKEAQAWKKAKKRTISNSGGAVD